MFLVLFLGGDAVDVGPVFGKKDVGGFVDAIRPIFIPTRRLDVIFAINGLQIGAIIEDPFAHGGDHIGNEDLVERGAMREGAHFDLSYVVGNGDALKATAEVESYCSRELDKELESIVVDIAIIKLHRLNTEGLASMSASGVAETYIDGYPAEIKAVLNRKRKLKVL